MDKVLHSSNSTEWHTPEVILEAVRRIGPIALDPCTVASNPTGAEKFFTLEDNGLEQSWICDGGLCFMNPPYGRAIAPWCVKAALAARCGTEMVCLLPSRTDTRWMNTLWRRAQGIVFISGRLTFKGAPNPAPFPSALIYLGSRHWRFFRAFDHLGFCVDRGGGWFG